jgi:hypothetical protein
MLHGTKEFSDKYFILEIPRIHDIQHQNGLKEIPYELLLLVDVFIYQKVSKNNDFGEKLSSDYIIDKLRVDCKKICITNPWFYGYYPQSYLHDDKNDKNVCYDENRYGLFPYKDYYIEKCYKKGNIDSAIQALSVGEQGLQYEVIPNLVKSFEIIENQELNCDIKIIDYIKSEYRKKRLFYTLNHPINEVLKVIAYRICIYLDLVVAEVADTAMSLEGFDQAIYPFVKEILNLEFSNNFFYSNKAIEENAMVWSDYVRMYINKCLEK